MCIALSPLPIVNLAIGSSCFVFSSNLKENWIEFGAAHTTHTEFHGDVSLPINFVCSPHQQVDLILNAISCWFWFFISIVLSTWPLPYTFPIHSDDVIRFFFFFFVSWTFRWSFFSCEIFCVSILLQRISWHFCVPFEFLAWQRFVFCYFVFMFVFLFSSISMFGQ